MRRFSRVIEVAAIGAIIAASSATLAQSLPPDEGAFLSAIQEGQASFQSAHNDLAKGNSRGERTAALCRILAPTQGAATNWVGRVASMRPANNESATLEITIGDGITVGTWPNPLSDVQDMTLIPPASPLFPQVAALKPGDPVIFSGRFMPDPAHNDCAREMNRDYEGKMMAPEFAFRFSAVGRH